MKDKKSKGKLKKTVLISILGALAITAVVLIAVLPVTYRYNNSLVVKNEEYNVVRLKASILLLPKQML